MTRVSASGDLIGEQGLWYKDNAGNEVEVTPATPVPVSLTSSPANPTYITLVDGQKATYSASIVGLSPAAAATDVFVLGGSASKTIRVTRVRVAGIQTTGGVVDLALVKRSTADTAGTSTAPVAVAHDSTDPAATATVAAYTANPTLGTSAGVVRADKTTVPGATGQLVPLVYDFGVRPGARAMVLRGAAQQLAVNLNGQTVAGGSFDISVEWTED